MIWIETLHWERSQFVFHGYKRSIGKGPNVCSKCFKRNNNDRDEDKVLTIVEKRKERKRKRKRNSIDIVGFPKKNESR